MSGSVLAMDDVANDLRILRLAEMYEDAYEAFVRRVALRFVDDEESRRKLLSLAPTEAPHAERIHEHRARVESKLRPEDKPAVLVGALIDVVEVERAARDFYFSNLARLRDPQLVELFRTLAHEEGEHAEIAEDMLRKAREAAGEESDAGVSPEDLAIFRDAEPFLREGVLDFGASGKPRRPRRRPRSWNRIT